MKNEADTLAYSSEKALQEYGDKIPAEDKAAIEDAIQEVKTALNENNIEKIRTAKQKLEQASQKMGQAIYQQQAGAGAGTEAGGQQSGPQGSAQGGPETGKTGSEDEDVVDAEFTVDNK